MLLALLCPTQVNCISLESLSHWLQDYQGAIVANPLCNGCIRHILAVQDAPLMLFLSFCKLFLADVQLLQIE